MSKSGAGFLAVDPAQLGLGKLFEANRDAVVGGDLDAHRIVLWNDAATATFGYSREEAVGAPLDLLTPQRYKRAHRDAIARVLAGGRGTLLDDTSGAVELRALRKDGEEIDIELSLMRVEGPIDRTYALAIIRDITDRKRTELELRRFFDVSLDMLCVASFEGNFLSLNPAWEAVLGWTPEELKAKPFVEFVHPDDVEKTLVETASLASGFETISFENRYRCKDGTYRWLLWNAHPSVEDGVVYAAARNITARKEAEQELARSNADLEQFSYVASHDLQEPLRMIASYVQLLQRRYHGKLDDDADEFIGYAVEGAARMQELINDLLTYSRVGRAGRPAREVELERVMRDVLKNLEPSIVAAGARVTHDAMPVVVGDAPDLAQLLQNLIGNAVKFRGERAPLIHVGAAREDDGWLLSVADNGIGIDPQFAGRIFSVFQRLHTQAEYAGTGIGLAICQKIVERHGGRIWVESEPDRGATFWFTIPDRRPDAVERERG